MTVIALDPIGAGNMSTVPEFVDEFIVLPLPNIIVAGGHWISRLLRGRAIPLQAALFWSRSNQGIVDKVLLDNATDVVIGDMVRTGEYLARVPKSCRKIADLDDLLSVRYKRQMEYRSNSSPVGSSGSSKHVQAVSRLIAKIRLLKTIIGLESTLLERYERRLAVGCDSTVLVSPVEACQLEERCPEDTRIYSVPVVVDDRLLQATSNEHPRHLITFLGALNVPHNLDAIITFIDRIWPKILSKDPLVRLRIVGRGAPKSLVDKTCHDSTIDFVGEVSDFVPYLTESKVFVAPMWYGSGVKTKILEAMALALPVVTTPIGCEGIKGKEGIHYAVATTEQDFADQVFNLLNDDAARTNMGCAARHLISSAYTFDTALVQWKDLIY